MFFQNIPTNLIIGFLGVGKTTAIRHLLSQVPEGQRWAVLVNEFGEVGVDGAFLREEDVAVEEVAGGCMCCVTGAGLQVGLNRLIRQYKPDRILTEPTGLGHPAQVIETLTTPPFAGVLDVRATICLVDAKQLSDSRYTEHPTYQDQIFLADILVANKSDTYEEEDIASFQKLVKDFDSPRLHYALTTQGRIQAKWLDLPRDSKRKALFPEAHAFIQATASKEAYEAHQAITEWTRIENLGYDFFSCGWLIPAEDSFSHDCLKTWFEQLDCLRIKAVLNTDSGWMRFNLAGDDQDIQPAPEQTENRLEIIDAAARDWLSMEEQLKTCLEDR